MQVIILAPVGRDAALLARTLTASGIVVAIAADADALLPLLAEGVGAAIIADEALSPNALQALAAWIAGLPPWSDPPFIVLTSGGIPTRQTYQRAQELQALGNLTLLERPVRPETVRLAARSALRARMRQYEVRSRQEALVQANADLEQFAHSASHDLREPLRSIGIASDLLALEYPHESAGRAGELLRLIREGVDRIDGLLTDLLAYAHSSSIMEEELPAVPAQRAVDVALKNLTAAICESRATITMGELPAIRCAKAISPSSFRTCSGTLSNTVTMTGFQSLKFSQKKGMDAGTSPSRTMVSGYPGSITRQFLGFSNDFIPTASIPAREWASQSADASWSAMGERSGSTPP